MSFFSAILSKFLDQYINKVEGKQIKISLIDGHAELHHVSLTQNMLISLGIPLIIKDSKVEQVVVDFPIMKNTNKAAYLKIINVDIFALPEWDALNKIPMTSVAEVIQSIEDEKKATKLERRKVWNSWFEKVIDNATIEIRNIRLHIQFNLINGKASGLTLFLDSLLMNTIDSNGNIIILEKKPEILTKRLKMTSFAIALHTNIEPFQKFEQLNDIQFNLLQNSSFNLIMIHDRKKKSSFLNSFTLTIEPIFFNFNQDQFFALQYLFNDFSKSKKRQKFLSCLKPSNKKRNKVYYIKMWCFLFRCAIKIRRAHEFRPKLALQFLRKRKEFALNLEKALIRKMFIQKTVDKFGEDLTFLLLQYSSIVSRRKERVIKLNKKEIDAINNEEFTFFSKDSICCKVNIQGICFNLDSLMLLSINNISAAYEKKRKGIKVNLEIKNWLIDDTGSNYKVVQTNENDNFIRFQILSRDSPAILSISSFKFDVRSSFLSRFCNFFINPQLEVKQNENESIANNEDNNSNTNDKNNDDSTNNSISDFSFDINSNDDTISNRKEGNNTNYDYENTDDSFGNANNKECNNKNDTLNSSNNSNRNKEENNKSNNDNINKTNVDNNSIRISTNNNTAINKEDNDDDNDDDENDDSSSKSRNRKVKSSDLNQYLLMINPRTLMRFKVILSGFSATYSIESEDKESQHTFSSEIKHIQLKNYSKSSTESKLIVKTKMEIGQIQVDNDIISKGFSLKSTTTGLIDEFYYIDKISTNLDVLNAKVDMNSPIVEKAQNVLSSITSSTQNYSTKIYSSHKININCSDISIFVNTGRNSFILSISGIEVKPSLMFRNIAITGQNSTNQMVIPSICLDKIPIIETDVINVDLNANEFYCFLDEINWISSQGNKIYSSAFPSIPTEKESEDKDKDNGQFKVLSHLINYKMGSFDYLIKFHEVMFGFGKDYVFDIDSFEIFNENEKQFLFCDNKIQYIMSSHGYNYITTLNISNLNLNFLWKEVNVLKDYYSHLGPNYYENMDIESFKPYQYFYSYEIQKMTINFEGILTLIVDKFMYDYKWGEKNWGVYFEKLDLVNVLQIGQFNYQNNDFYSNLSISSITAYISPNILSDFSKLSFISNITESFSSSENQADQQTDMNVIIDNIVIIELFTKLTLTIPTTSFTTNSYHSISALHIPTINFENLVFNFDVVLLYNSTDFNIENINSVFLLDRKKLPENHHNELSKIIVNIDKIDFEYTHYFVMRIYNAFKLHSNSNFDFNFNFNFERNTNNESKPKYTISANIHQINIKEHNLPEPISLSKLSFQQNEELIELKCHSFKCLELIKKENESGNTDFFVIQKNSTETSLKVNPVDIYLNIESIKKLTNIYESLSSLIKTNRDEKLNKNLSQKVVQTQNKKKIMINDQNYSVELSGINIHFPFEDDPLFKEHDLTFTFKLFIQIQQNLSKLLKISQVNMYFSNYKKQKEIEFYKILNNASFQVQIQNDKDNSENHFSLLEIETGKINIYLSVLDILELQIMIKRFRELILNLLNQKTYSFPDDSQIRNTFSIDQSKVDIKPISISICEESRASLPIFTIYIEATASTLNLRGENHEFAIVLNFSIMHNNFFYGKFETFMPPTEFLILYSNTESNASYFALSVKNDIDFNLTPYSFRSLIKFIDKFQNQEKVLQNKDSSRFNYNPEYWIRNSLDDVIYIEYNEKGSDKNDHSILYISPSDRLPLCQINQDMLLNFRYRNVKGSFIPRKLLFPTYFESISVSIHHHDNYSQTIVFKSPLSIQNRLDTKITIYINSDESNKHFVFYTTLLPECVYPLPFEERSYFILSDFESVVDSKIKRRDSQKNQSANDNIQTPQIDQKNLPEIFCLSKNRSPPFIKIQNIENQNSISFILNVNNDIQTNSRIYEIIPSFLIRNCLPCSISAQFYYKESMKVSNGRLMFQSLDERQIIVFNHDTQNILISLSFNEESFERPVQIKLDKYDGIFAGCDGAAIIIQKLLKTEQKELIIFSPCAIFNKTQETIFFSPSSRSSSSSSSLSNLIHKVLPQSFTLYGLDSYSEKKKSLKIDISLENSETKLKAIDCMRLNSNCTTIYLPRTDNRDLFYPINCSITLARFPMNATHVVTFTPYLYVINNLPFDFSLVPITSGQINLIDSTIVDVDTLHQQIENESEFLLNDSFFIPHHKSGENDNCVLIKWIPKNGMFLFSLNEYRNNPIIQLSSITRTVFLVKNKTDQMFIEVNIYENESTLYASFQTPSFPAPLVINNSLSTSITVYQNIKPVKNKIIIEANSSSLFAFDEPFINNKQIFIEVSKDNENKENREYKSFLFSMEGQLSPLISHEYNINIYTTIISKNNSKMIQVRYLNDNIVYHSTFRGFLSIHSLRMSLSNDEMNEIVLFTLNDIISETCQDNKNTFLTLFIKSIQLDDQNTATKIPVSVFGTGQEMLNENNKDSKINKFFNLFSIFPRGVPIFSVINFMSIQIQPIFIIAESNFVANLLSFLVKNFKSIYNVKKNQINKNSNINFGEMLLKPSFNSVNVSKTLISYLEINPINLIINIPSETSNDRFYIATVKWLLKIISMNKLTISIPKLFVSDFNHNISYLMDLFRNFYGKELMKQISKNAVIQFFASFLIHFKKIHFVPLSSINNDDALNDSENHLCDNRKQIFKYFNQIELNYIDKQSNFYFNQSPDVIRQLIDKDVSLTSLSNILIFHPSSHNLTKRSNSKDRNNVDRLILGITNDSNAIPKESNNDLIQLFNSKEIKRVRIPYISPIYSSFDDPLGRNAKIDSNFEDVLKLNNSSEIYNIYVKIQSEILKNKKLENQIIKFIIQDKTKELLYCITNEKMLIFNMQEDNIRISNEYNLMIFTQISASGYTVSLSSDVERIGEIKIEFIRKTDAKTLMSFIVSQQTVIKIFGKVLSKS